MSHTLRINEIFRSIQGESTWAGWPCTFVRLTGCHLRCTYCDTAYAFHEGRRMAVDQVVEAVGRLTACPPSGRIEGAPDRAAPEAPGSAMSPPPLVEITGGEPLLQPNVHPLMSRLCDAGYALLIETSGACDISACDPRVIRIMDLKTPGSGEVDRNDWSNIERLHQRDEVKFVLTRRSDYEWAREVIGRYDLAGRVKAVLMGVATAGVSPPSGGIAEGHAERGASSTLPGTPSPNPRLAGRGVGLADLAEWILADRLPVRLQTQLHKLIWPAATGGV